jgi:hypothetical protein
LLPLSRKTARFACCKDVSRDLGSQIFEARKKAHRVFCVPTSRHTREREFDSTSECVRRLATPRLCSKEKEGYRGNWRPEGWLPKEGRFLQIANWLASAPEVCLVCVCVYGHMNASSADRNVPRRSLVRLRRRHDKPSNTP